VLCYEYTTSKGLVWPVKIMRAERAKLTIWIWYTHGIALSQEPRICLDIRVLKVL